MRARLLLVAIFAGCTDGGDTDSDTDPDTDTDLPEVVDAVLGQACALDQRLATVRVQRWGSGGNASFSAQIWDRTDPWMGPAALSNDHCDFHTFNIGSCGRCDPGMVCDFDGGCTAERRAVKDVVLTVETGGDSSEHTPTDEGYLFGDVPGSEPVGMVLATPKYTVTLAPMTVPSGDLASTVRAAGDYDKPDALTFEWTLPPDGGAISTLLPINHHAAGPTFTACYAQADQLGFVADADMVNPLSVITGLEYQGLDHIKRAAANVPGGCVEFVFETRILSDVQYPG